MNPNVLTPDAPEGAPFERRDFIVSTYKHLGAAMLAFVVLSAVLMMTGFSGTAAKMLLGSGFGNHGAMACSTPRGRNASTTPNPSSPGTGSRFSNSAVASM